MSEIQSKLEFIQYSMNKLTRESISIPEIKDTYFKLFSKLHKCPSPSGYTDWTNYAR